MNAEAKIRLLILWNAALTLLLFFVAILAVAGNRERPVPQSNSLSKQIASWPDGLEVRDEQGRRLYLTTGGIEFWEEGSKVAHYSPYGMQVSAGPDGNTKMLTFHQFGLWIHGKEHAKAMSVYGPQGVHTEHYE